MSGETRDTISGWTTDTLHEHVSRQLIDLRRATDERHQALRDALNERHQAQKEAVAAALSAAEKAVIKAEASTNLRIDALNELRQVVNDISALQMPRVEAEQRMAALAEQVTDIKLGVTATTGRSAGLNAGWGYLVGAAGLGASVALIASRIAGG